MHSTRPRQRERPVLMMLTVRRFKSPRLAHCRNIIHARHALTAPGLPSPPYQVNLIAIFLTSA
jgi:hypothetical protein